MTEQLKKEIRQRVALWLRQQGRCHWCGCEMILIANPPDKGDGARWKAFKEIASMKNLATVDHLDSRLSPERGKHPGEFRNVAACKGCNEKRAADEEAKLPLEEKHRRARSYPVIGWQPFATLLAAAATPETKEKASDG